MIGGGKLCNQFQAGSCKFGNNCKFVHPGQPTQAGQGGGGGNPNYSGQGGGGYKGGGGGNPNFGGQGGGGYKGGGGNPNFNAGGGGGNFGGQGGGNPNFGGQGGGGQNYAGGRPNQRKFGPKPTNNSLCNFFLQGSCNKGDNCQNLHQFSLDFDIMGEKLVDLKEMFNTKSINLLTMDIYEANLSPLQIAILVCTPSQLSLLVIPGGTKVDLPKADGEFTAMHFDPSNKLVFAAYISSKNQKAGIKIYKDTSGSGTFQEVASGADLHDSKILSIQTQNIMNNIVIISGAQDDRVKAWVVGNEGKFEVVAVGVATKPICDIKAIGECVVAGCKDGRVEVFRFSLNTKELIREKEFSVHNDPESMVLKIMSADEALYALSCGPGPNGTSGQIGFFSTSPTGKIANLVNMPLEHGGGVVMEYMPASEIIFIGYVNGVLEFRDKDGFTEKGKAGVHKAPIKSIKQFNELFIVADESGLFTVWRILDEKTAEATKAEYMAKKGGGGGNAGFGGAGGGAGFGAGGGQGFGGAGGGFGGGGFGNAGMGMGGF